VAHSSGLVKWIQPFTQQLSGLVKWLSGFVKLGTDRKSQSSALTTSHTKTQPHLQLLDPLIQLIHPFGVSREVGLAACEEL
jgi:hypothetical protein